MLAAQNLPQQDILGYVDNIYAKILLIIN